MDLKDVGLSTFLWPGMSVGGWVELAGELGLGGVELRTDPRAAFPPDLALAERRELRDRLAKAGLWCTVHVPIYGVNLASPFPSLAAASLGEVVEAVDLAADVGAELVVVHPGHVDPDFLPLDGERERATQRFRFALEVILAWARRREVKVAVENKQRSPGWDMVHSAAEHRSVLDWFRTLGACLDFGHLHTLGGEPASYVAALGERLVHVHLHDNHGERDEHLPLGTGTVPWRVALAALAGRGYGGRIVLEIPDPAGVRKSVAVVRRR
ncbi:MAG TPA: sugar phosphate isomerase/epimerase [Candidatus Acetothermia bacterium]|nr:sugar phosphate isomerase/epimerase [Candidatus Acetothermia bacterium]